MNRWRIFYVRCFLRLWVVVLVSDNSFDLPVTQVQLGDVFGLSTVHVNRMLQPCAGAILLPQPGGALSSLTSKL
jgi:hypothetical protein